MRVHAIQLDLVWHDRAANHARARAALEALKPERGDLIILPEMFCVGFTLDVDLPAALAGNGDPFAASAPAHSRAISAGMFGSGFALRLARAEAEAIGGTLVQDEDRLRLVLPVLTASRAVHTQDHEGNDGR